MQKKYLSIFIIFLIICASSVFFSAIPASAAEKAATNAAPVSFIFATDIHYLKPELMRESQAFKDALATGDGKLVEYIDEIVDAFIAQVIEANPTALVLGGDISFNGEKLSHEALAAKLQRVRDAGIPVLVIPGNHDINRTDAREYRADGVYRTPYITPEAFRDLYFPLGADGGIAFYDSALSYVYRLGDNVSLLMIDDCRYEAGNVHEDGYIKPVQMAWLKEQLRLAKEEGQTVITVSHHNLLEHNSRFESGYALINWPAPLALFEEYGVALHMSGHMHIQHVKQAHEGYGIFDAANSALAVWPFQYAVVEVDSNGEISLSSQRTNVDAWAASVQSENETLLNFNQYAYDYTFVCNGAHIDRRLAEYPNISAQDKEKMVMAAQILHAEYFAGLPYSVAEDDEGFGLWRKNCPELSYVESVRVMFNEKTLQLPIIIDSRAK
ncbi:MAG: metallophosphoesterase [Oscillospiraceae bacterium]|jgi:3',5'-cyclic AMP phosphodiesterase CpdA|nr:metallophosphoesterase [Oscillospiraceae bacterium]